MTNMIDVNGPALQARVKRILTDPQSEWPVIAAEPTTTEKLYSSYIVPLAAIPAIAGFIGTSIIGVGGFFTGIMYRVGIIPGIVWAFISFVISLVRRDMRGLRSVAGANVIAQRRRRRRSAGSYDASNVGSRARIADSRDGDARGRGAPALTASS